MKYYSYITPSAVGISTQWSYVETIVKGTKGAMHKSFPTYDEAQNFILSNLSEMDRLDFGLDKNPLYINKKFIRKKQYIEEKKAQNSY